MLQNLFGPCVRELEKISGCFFFLVCLCLPSCTMYFNATLWIFCATIVIIYTPWLILVKHKINTATVWSLYIVITLYTQPVSCKTMVSDEMLSVWPTVSIWVKMVTSHLILNWLQSFIRVSVPPLQAIISWLQRAFFFFFGTPRWITFVLHFLNGFRLNSYGF